MSPCLNSGTCTNTADGYFFSCDCSTSYGYSGTRCEIGFFKLLFIFEWFTKRKEIVFKNNKAPCDSSLCQNGGTCSNTAYGDFYTCNCTTSAGYTGKLCEIGFSNYFIYSWITQKKN